MSGCSIIAAILRLSATREIERKLPIRRENVIAVTQARPALSALGRSRNPDRRGQAGTYR